MSTFLYQSCNIEFNVDPDISRLKLIGVFMIHTQSKGNDREKPAVFASKLIL